MPRNEISAMEFKTRVLKIKNELDGKNTKYGDEAKGLAHKYLNLVLDAIDENYRLMKIPGYIVTDLLLVTILGTFMVLCITLPISPTNGRQYIGRKYFWSHRKPPGKNDE